MVSDTGITVGEVVRIQSWHGVVLETNYDEMGALSVIRVQTARNLFRGFGPEYIDIRLNPDAIMRATLADLQQEIATHHRMLEGAVARLLGAVHQPEKCLPVAAD
jgi:hypothetical protein